VIGVNKYSLDIEVAQWAPDGCDRVAVDLFAPVETVLAPLLWVCVPGGGMDRQYFDLEVSGDDERTYSMARVLAAGGNLVVTIDPPGVGDSDTPTDGYSLSPECVSDVLAGAVQSLVVRLRNGETAIIGATAPRAIIGVGHSAGALLVAYQQARHSTYDALGLLGFSASGLANVLNVVERRYVQRPAEFANARPELTRARFGEPLPQGSSSSADEFGGGSDALAIDTALSKATSKLLALVGMTAIVPGSVQPQLDQLQVPIFAALGERDLAGTLDVLPAQFPNCGDLTLFLVKGAGHNHNIAANRLVLWRRLMHWANSVAHPNGLRAKSHR
jgi:pimeloyl-ACP methyl ester carboxylesterase